MNIPTKTFLIIFNILLIIGIVLCYYLDSYPNNLKMPTILLFVVNIIIFPIGVKFMNPLKKNNL
jgi:uncharacterized membrane protein YdjX (TVP38/TMEM64 family)